MRGRWGDALSLASVAMMLSGIGYSSGHSQVVMEETFSMETSACDGMSCRKEIIGANEALGVGAVAACSQSTNYWKGDLEYAPAGHTELFELWYSCRKVSLLGESAMLMSWEECGMVAEPCLDIGFDPDTFEVTYQVSFDFTSMAAYDVSVDVKVYMSYLQVDDDFYTLRSKDPTRCDLRETCHRSCETGESGFIAELEDSMGDGWNAGGINHFDHFRLESQSELAAVVAADMTPSTNDTNGTTAAAAAAASARRTSYKNTMLAGSSRKVPVCLSDGEYLFSTEFQVPTPDPLATYGTYSAPDRVFSVGGRHFSESSWTFCGYTGMLSDYTHVRVSGGVCVATDGWGQAAAPSATPVVGVEEAPTPAPTPTITIAGSPISSPTAPPADGTDDAFAEDDDDEVVSDEGGQNVDGGGEGDGNDGGGGGGDGDVDADGDGGSEGDGDGDGGSEGDGDGDGDGEGDGNEAQDIASDDSGKSTLTKLEIWGIGLGAAGLAGLAAAGGTYAQNKGWFAPAGVGGGAAAGGGGGGAPNPDVDEFAP